MAADPPPGRGAIRNFLSLIAPFWRGPIEHPDRLLPMKKEITGSFGAIAETKWFIYIDDLVYSEIIYYYRKRKYWALGSSALRIVTWGFGLAGVLAPFVAAISTDQAGAATNIGYMLLAIAAACAGANSLFGLTTGHMRFLVAQLRLERLMTSRRLGWLSLCAASGGPGTGTDAAGQDAGKRRQFISEYADLLYREMELETDGWTKEMAAALKKLSSDIEPPGKS